MDSRIKIYDHVLSDKDSQDILNAFHSEYFSWHYGSEVVPCNQRACDPLYDMQFFNAMYYKFAPRSEEFKVVTSILDLPILNIAALIRIKANFNPVTEKIITHGFHVDFPVSCTTAIYYVNTCNGYTEFED